ncbi:DUF2505 domain-containing protein [Demequina capsici]|uniref:DUF2505 domain-containing protein n=1 Tax=Demequina capsici TaxID=3075620 RepID=A0AA96J9V0_9MICO|nr:MULTISPECIES: DUF2505 domain-containing protein [unclassified Demequina]WNM23896.1 DUF2505 domain-containing protein [Demequina sp. OYTSA14]WNM26735.1 DUF2505 domain-containing protein [Demequina sp. PMTSA13]
MDFTHRHRFDASLDAVVTMLADPDFARVRGEASGATLIDMLVDGTPDTGFTVSLRREAPTRSIPAEMRPLVGSRLVVTYTEVWEPPEDGERIGTFAVEVMGAPGHVAGALGLRPDGDGTDMLTTGSVTVSMPLVGPMIERGLVGSVTRTLQDELAAADEWLAARR